MSCNQSVITPLFLAISMLVIGCGDDQPEMPDAKVSIIDAAKPGDASAADAQDTFDPCPGKPTFQVGVADWKSKINLPGVKVQEVGTENIVTSAPNGRVVLCLEGAGPLQIKFSHPDYIDIVHNTSAAMVSAQFSTNYAPQFWQIKADALEQIYASVSKTAKSSHTTLIAMIHDKTIGIPMPGAMVSTDANHEGSFVRSTASTTVLETATTSSALGRLLFLNTQIGSGTTNAQTSNLVGCIGGTNIVLQAGAISSVDFQCDSAL